MICFKITEWEKKYLQRDQKILWNSFKTSLRNLLLFIVHSKTFTLVYQLKHNRCTFEYSYNENQKTKRQHHSVFHVVTKQKNLISNLLNHLFSFYKGLLESKMSLSMPEFSGYPATYEWMLWNKRLSLIYIQFS